MKDIALAEMNQDLSDTFVVAQDNLALPEPQCAELVRRLQAYRHNPQPVSS